MLALGFVCYIFSLSGCSIEEKIDMSEHYGEYVSTLEAADLYTKQAETYEKIATVHANIIVHLAAESVQNMETTYFKLANQDIYIEANKVTPTQGEEEIKPYLPYVPFNENIKTKDDFTLYNEDQQSLYTIASSQTYPILIKENGQYGICINEQLYYVHEEDVIEVIESENTTTETANEIPVLMYHAFYDASNPPEDLNGNYLEKEAFREQLQYLRDHEFTTLRMLDVERYVDGKVRLPRHSVAITMDDGYENEAVIAGPLLHEFGFYGTAFLITNWFQNEGLPAHWQAAPSLGLELQSHSHGLHTGGCDEQHGGRILCEDYETAVEDVKFSMEFIHGNVFCYPFGDFNDRAKDILKDAGIHMAFTTQYGTIEPGMDKLELPRVRVHGDASLERFAASITY